MTEKNNKPSVLIVEEEPSVLVLLGSMLEKNGFRALLARNRREAVEIASRQYVPVDLVLSDVEVAGDSGPDLVDDLRQLRKGLRVVYLSAMIEAGIIRVKVMRQMGPRYFTNAGSGLVESLRDAMSVSLLHAGA